MTDLRTRVKLTRYDDRERIMVSNDSKKYKEINDDRRDVPWGWNIKEKRHAVATRTTG